GRPGRQAEKRQAHARTYSTPVGPVLIPRRRIYAVRNQSRLAELQRQRGAVGRIAICDRRVNGPAKQVELLEAYSPCRLPAGAIEVELGARTPAVLGGPPKGGSRVGMDAVDDDAAKDAQCPKVASRLRDFGGVERVSRLEEELALHHASPGRRVNRICKADQRAGLSFSRLEDVAGIHDDAPDDRSAPRVGRGLGAQRSAAQNQGERREVKSTHP